MKNNKRGITLVALVVTIIVLLILAGITITILFSDDGIITKAQNAANATNTSVEEEIQGITDLGNKMNSILDGIGTGGGSEGAVVDIDTVTTTDHETLKAEDSHGNIVTVPEGFKVVEGSAGEEITVENGVVIEDSAGNQFVWIPVGVVTKNDGNKSSEIKLGRYTFDSNGTPVEQQLAYTTENPTNYLNTVTIVVEEFEYQELSVSRSGNTLEGEDGENATAKNLAAFVQSVKNNGGYYLARYEASYGSGYDISGSTDAEKYANAKPLSKESKGFSEDSISYTEGILWNFITQVNASKVSRNMYLNNKDANGNNVGVESDLINSYAWDTAIVYIQEMGHTNYANANRDTTGNTSLMNTGTTGDVVCNIYDMAANTQEWDTEYNAYISETGVTPCVDRGGYYHLSLYGTGYRRYAGINSTFNRVSFRPVLYISD